MERKNSKNIKNNLLRYLLLFVGTVICTLPMIYMISVSLRPNGALYEFPPRFFPKLSSITLENYEYIINQSKFYINFINSVIVSISSVLLSAIIASTLGFVLAQFEFKGKSPLFIFIVITMIIPGTTMIVPQFELATQLKLVNKETNKQKQMLEAAYIDGADIFTVFHKIAVPMALPAIASVSIFNFLTCWEEYPWANTVINNTELRTLPIAIAGFFGQHQFTQWGYVFAMSVLTLIPVVIVFITCQRFFIKGLTSGSVKG